MGDRSRQLGELTTREHLAGCTLGVHGRDAVIAEARRQGLIV